MVRTTKMVTSAPTGGFKPMAIGGRVVRERERLQGMSAEERAWRKQWLKDQVLTEREPVTKYTWQNPVQNSFRRFYQKPLDVLIWKPLIPLMVRFFFQPYVITKTLVEHNLNWH